MSTAKRDHVLGHLRTFLAGYRRYVWTVVLYAAALGLLGLATPIAVQALVNTAAFGIVLQPILVLAVMVLAVLLLGSAIRALKAWAVEVLQRRIFADTVARLAYVLPRSDLEGVREQRIEQPTHRFFEVFFIQKAASSLLLGGVDVVLLAFVGLLVLAFYHPVLLAFDVGLIVAIVIIVFVLGKSGVETAVKESTAKYRIASFLAEVARAPLAFRDPCGERYVHRELDALSNTYLRSREGHFRVVFRQLLGAVITQAVASAALLGLGGFLVIRRELTLGQLVAAELIVTAIVSALSDLGKYLETYYDLAAGVYKLDQLLDLPVEAESADAGKSDIKRGPAHVAISNLHLSSRGRAIFDGARLTIEAGARIQLVGPGESGKSSLLDLLYGLRRADRGAIVVDGVDTRELSRAALRERIAVVRGPEIIPGTVVDNVRLGRTEMGVGEVRVLLDKLGLLEELSDRPEGLETWLGPAGARLSDSQALRLTLARALARSPGLLAVDTDLSTMDAATVERVMRELARSDAPWTLLVIGDNVGASRWCTEVVRLHNGRFSEGGE